LITVKFIRAFRVIQSDSIPEAPSNITEFGHGDGRCSLS